jgi:thiazole/oxazole-forming peptide maturase SagC family component
VSDYDGLPLKPKVPNHFAVVHMEDGRIQIRGARKTVLLGGKSAKAVGRLLELMDGTRRLAEIAVEFPDVPEVELKDTIKRLMERGLVEDAASDAGRTLEVPGPKYEAQMTLFDVTSQFGKKAAQEALAGSKVSVFGLGRVGSCAVESLVRAGIGGITAVDSLTVDSSLPSSGGLYNYGDIGLPRAQVVAERLRAINPRLAFDAVDLDLNDGDAVSRVIRRSSLVLVCCDGPEVAAYREVNPAAVAERVPWLKAAVDGFEAHLGPTVIPGETACYTCYELRTRANWNYYEENMAFEEYLVKEPTKVDYGGLAAISGFTGNLAALETIKILTGFMPPLTCGRFFTFRIGDFDMQPHRVMKLPRCPTCGIVALRPKTSLWSLEGTSP